jgi:CubicO group peptidase (beta-lactamase class C family)
MIMKPINAKHKMSLALLVTLLSVLWSCSSTASLENELDNIASAYTSKYKPPGLAVAVFQGEDPIWSYSYGYANLESKLPFSGNVVMNIGSVSKTITTTAVLQLWESGKLDLDADVNEYIDFSVRNPKHKDSLITVRHLLTHTSSIKDGKAYLESYKCGASAVSLYEWIRNYLSPEGRYYDAENNFYEWSAGADYNYSNIAYGLLGLLVEQVSNQEFEVYCQENIFSPLGMHDSSWFLSGIDRSKQAKQYALSTEDNENIDFMAKLISKEVDGYYELCDYSFHNYPDGLFKTSINQLAGFLQATINGGSLGAKQILKAETVAEMLSMQVEDNEIQGLGWKKVNYESVSFWGHSGRDPGVRTHMYFDPKSKIGIILFQNNDEGATLDLIEDIYMIMERKALF